MKVITLKDLKETACWPLNHSLEVLDKKCPKKSKYSSTKTEIDGITFHSLKESRRYLELRMLKNAGLITNLRLQKPYELNESGAYSLKYIADFVYINEKGNEIVEDVKGMRLPEYKKKRKLMLKIHNITIKET